MCDQFLEWDEMRKEMFLLKHGRPSDFIRPEWPIPCVMFVVYRFFLAAYVVGFFTISIIYASLNNHMEWLVFLTNWAYAMLTLSSVLGFISCIASLLKKPCGNVLEKEGEKSHLPTVKQSHEDVRSPANTSQRSHSMPSIHHELNATPDSKRASPKPGCFHCKVSERTPLQPDRHVESSRRLCCCSNDCDYDALFATQNITEIKTISSIKSVVVPLGLPWYFEAYWITRNISYNLAFVIAFAFWTLLFDYRLSLTIISANQHVVNIMLVILDLCVSATPMRFAHAWHSVAFVGLYILFSIIYWAVGGTRLTDQPIAFKILDYSQHPFLSAFVIIFLLTVMLPIIQFILHSITRFRIFFHEFITDCSCTCHR